MNEKMKAFVVSLSITIVAFIIAIITFAQGVWFGVFPIAIGLFFLLRYTIPAWKEYQELKPNPSPSTVKKENPFDNPLMQIEFAEEMLVSYYMDLAEDSAIEYNLEQVLSNKKDILELKIRNLIKKQKEMYGTDFLTKDNPQAKEINSNIGKYAFGITIFYLFGLENSFPDEAFDDIIQAIIDVLKLDEEYKVFDEAMTKEDILFNDYLTDMIAIQLKQNKRQG